MNESTIHSDGHQMGDSYSRQNAAYLILVDSQDHSFNAHQISVYFTVAFILVQFNGAPLVAPTAII
jgi:hypothetical protein